MEEEVECESQWITEELGKRIGFQRIDIVLDHPQKVYYSGHQISGSVHVELEEPELALGIRLKCKGEAQVYFTDRSAGLRRKFSASENYVHVETYIAGDGKEKTAITSGVYPFSLTLPEDLPCSFEGRYGRVRYSIRASLDITTAYRFSTNIIPFTVVPILDLNRDPLAPLPIHVQQSKTYVGQAEAISLSMTLPVHGYVPGQAIPIKIVMTNPSTVVVVMYHSTEKSRKHKEIVVEVEQPVGKESDAYDVTFDVPAVPPTGMIHCNIIDVLYTLKVEACIDLSEWYYRIFQKNLKLRTNIVVGTVPLQNYEIPQKMVDETEGSAFQPSSTTVIEEHTDDAPSSKNVEKDEIRKPSLSFPLYEKSQIYRSSKPDKDDPTGDEGDSDGEVKPYSPMYRIYKFKSRKKSN